MAPTGAGTRMSATESILWRIERDPVLRSTVTAVSILDRAPDWARLRRRMLQASVRIPRLRQVVVEPPLGLGSPSWQRADDFDLDYHLRRVQLPRPTSIGALLDFAAREAMGEFDRARPLWEFTVVEHVGEGAALIQKFHHAVTDGVGGMRLALEMLDTESKPSRKVAPIASLAAQPPDGTGGGSSAVEQVAEAGRRVLGTSLGLAASALKASRTPLESALSAADSARWGARLVAPVAEPCSPIMRSRGIMLSFAAFDVDFARLREAGRRGQGSLNDAFITAVVAGLRRYHEAHAAPLPSLRMTLPISIRSEHDPVGGNRFTPVRFEIPLGHPRPAEMVPVISQLVREWRAGPALSLTDTLAIALNGLPTQAVTAVFGSMLKNVDFIATNVPGLPLRAYLAGAELLRQYAFAPPSGASVNVALLSHVGHCCIGVNIDRAAIPDTEVFVACLEEGFEEVMTLAGAPKRAGSGVAEAGSPS